MFGAHGTALSFDADGIRAQRPGAVQDGGRDATFDALIVVAWLGSVVPALAVGVHVVGHRVSAGLIVLIAGTDGAALAFDVDRIRAVRARAVHDGFGNPSFRASEHLAGLVVRGPRLAIPALHPGAVRASTVVGAGGSVWANTA